VLTLNRPEKRNALTHALVDELRGAIETLTSEPSMRALVLTGAGAGFCAGADLGGAPSDAGTVVREHYNPLVEALLTSVPIIAAVNGPAAGAGVSIALACDMRIAAPEARFELSFVKVGLVPDAGATWLLPRIVGSARAAEMALLGRRVEVNEAVEWGLVTRRASAETLRDEAVALAEGFGSLSSSVGAIKRLLREGLDCQVSEHLEREAAAQGLAQHGADYAEARAAFREKRPPVFARRSSVS